MSAQHFLAGRNAKMIQITLDDDQVQAVQQAAGAVEILDRRGVLIGYVTRPGSFTPAEIAEAQKRASWQGPWHTTEQLLARLHALEQK
jgi:hypothetical protein